MSVLHTLRNFFSDYKQTTIHELTDQFGNERWHINIEGVDVNWDNQRDHYIVSLSSRQVFVSVEDLYRTIGSFLNYPSREKRELNE